MDFPPGRQQSLDAFDCLLDNFLSLYTLLRPNHSIFSPLCLNAIVQRDERANEFHEPLFTEKDTMELIKKYQPQGGTLAKLKKSNATWGGAPGAAAAAVLGTGGFYRYIIGEDNTLVNPRHTEVYQDMQQPLSHYYVDSSHNTYLTGGQLASKSCCEIYRQCLLAGNRCLEIDIWDGADGPEVTHGHTMCSKIPFRDVIAAIAAHAWISSEWPLILSFENHCNPENQVKMASTCNELFGDSIARSINISDPESEKELPSPASLIRKIIIKNKRMRHHVEAYRRKKQGPAYQNNEIASIGVERDRAVSDTGDLAKFVFIVDGKEIIETDKEFNDRVARSGKIAKEMSDLVSFCWPVPFKGFDTAKNEPCFFMSSFAEQKGLSFCSGQPNEFVDYCKWRMARIYPKGTFPSFYAKFCFRKDSLPSCPLKTCPLQEKMDKQASASPHIYPCVRMRVAIQS